MFPLALLLALTIPNTMFSYDRDLKFTNLGLKEGLSQSMVNAILRDSKGFLWFATKDGLNRYDGYRFTHFTQENDDPGSLSSNYINKLFEDRGGVIWVGTLGGGLNRLEPGETRFARYQNDPRDPGSLCNDYVNAICEDSLGNIWIGTEKGLDHLPPGAGRFVHFRPGNEASRDIRIKCLACGKDGRIWIGLSKGGLARYDPSSGRFISYRHDPKNPGTLDDDEINALYTGADGRLWIGTANGLNLLDPAAEKVVRYDLKMPPPTIIIEICSDPNGNLWLATYEKGLLYLDLKTGKTVQYLPDPENPNSIKSIHITSLLIDKTGILWTGTSGFGINKANLAYKEFVNYYPIRLNPNSLSFSSIRAIYESGDRSLYIGGYGGLDRLDRNRNLWQRIRIRPGQEMVVLSCCPDMRDGREILLVGMEGEGILVFDPADRSLHAWPVPGLVGRDIYSFLKDRAGVFWIGTNLGLNRFDPAKKECQFFGLDAEWHPVVGAKTNYEVRSLYEDKSGVLWMGTSRFGLFARESGSNRFRHYIYNAKNPKSLGSNFICSVCEDSRGRLWVGTNGGGLNLFDPRSGSFVRFTTRQGLPNNVVYGILEDERMNLWLSTNNGISRFNPETRAFKNFNEGDGLVGNEFNSGAFHKNIRTGEMFFGGISGVSAFFPDKIRENPFPPSLVITDFKIFNQSVLPGEKSVLKKPISDTREIKLSYRDSTFSFEFIGLHYAAPEKNQYAYRMAGFDRDWNYVDASRRFATYTNLDPGTYIFQVKGSNDDGVWNETGTSLRIVITPPFWKTWWFYLSCLVLAGMVVLAAYEFRVSQLKKREKLLSLLVEQRTSELNKANEQLASANQELERLSLTDTLTQLPNRRNFELILAQEWKRCSRESQPLSLLMMDIDFFKPFNDTYGHPRGDECLKQVAASIQRCTSRAGDFVARLGGEEFVIILPNTHKAGAGLMAERVRSEVERLSIPHSASAVGPFVTISIGLATFVPDREKESDILIATADTELYKAKKAGRNRIQAAGGETGN